MVAGKDFIVALFTVKYVDSWPLFALNLTMLPFAIILDHSAAGSRAFRAALFPA